MVDASVDDVEPVVPLAERIVAPLRSTALPREREPDPADLEKVRKWQEERIETKLKGEYESLLLRLGELVRIVLNFVVIFCLIFKLFFCDGS